MTAEAPPSAWRVMEIKHRQTRGPNTAIPVLIAVALSLLFGGLQAAPALPNGYSEALKLYEQGKYEESMQVIRKFVTPESKPFELRMLAAAVYSKLGKPANATEHMILCIKEHPDRHEPRVFLVGLYRTMGKSKEAIGVARRALKDTGEHAVLRMELARIYYATNQTERSRQELALILKTDPRNAEAVMLDGLNFLKEGKLENAEFRLQQALHLKPESRAALARTYNNLGLCYELRARRLPVEQAESARRLLKEAQRYYQYALQTLPNFAPAKKNIARIGSEA